MGSLKLICDFVNTADLEDGVDKLNDPQGLQYWLVFHGLSELGDRASRADLENARTVREALRELLRANNGVEVDRDSASAILDDAARRSGLAVRFDDDGICFVATARGAAGGVAQVLAAVGETMADGTWQRLKACRSDTCRWAFIDRARNRSRQWCDMSVCGNRAKARAFRQRHG